MKPSNKIILVITCLFLFQGCEWFLGPGPCDASGPVIVYKTIKDYSNYISVTLSDDGERITAYPGPSDTEHQRPIELVDGYYLKRMVGNAFLSITFDEYTDTAKNWTTADLVNYVIDADPFLEIYECCECTGGDTAKINKLIRENRLDECENLK